MGSAVQKLTHAETEVGDDADGAGVVKRVESFR